MICRGDVINDLGVSECAELGISLAWQEPARFEGLRVRDYLEAASDGGEDDVVSIKESGELVGEGARGVLTTRVAARDEAVAEGVNKLKASAPYARGHVDFDILPLA